MNFNRSICPVSQKNAYLEIFDYGCYIQTTENHEGNVKVIPFGGCIAQIADTNRFVIIRPSKELIIWDTSIRTDVPFTFGKNFNHFCVLSSPNHLLTFNTEQKLQLWDISKEDQHIEIAASPVIESPVSIIFETEPGTVIVATKTQESKIYGWRYSQDSLKKIFEYEILMGRGKISGVNQCGNRLTVQTDFQDLLMLCLRNGKIAKTLMSERCQNFTDYAWNSPNGLVPWKKSKRVFFSGRAMNAIRLWSGVTGKALKSLHHKKIVYDFILLGDDKTIVLVSGLLQKTTVMTIYKGE
jgi:WD40 repeat protein